MLCDPATTMEDSERCGLEKSTCATRESSVVYISKKYVAHSSRTPLGEEVGAGWGEGYPCLLRLALPSHTGSAKEFPRFSGGTIGYYTPPGDTRAPITGNQLAGRRWDPSGPSPPNPFCTFAECPELAAVLGAEIHVPCSSGLDSTATMS